MIWESQGNRTVTEIITSQLQALQEAGLFSNKSLFLIVICSRLSQSLDDLALRIFEDLWHSFKISDVTIVIPYFKTAETYTSAIPGVQNSSNESLSNEQYSGTELNVLRSILQKLNLAIEYYIYINGWQGAFNHNYIYCSL
jgi:hypothetical protein